MGLTDKSEAHVRKALELANNNSDQAYEILTTMEFEIEEKKQAPSTQPDFSKYGLDHGTITQLNGLL